MKSTIYQGSAALVAVLLGVSLWLCSLVVSAFVTYSLWGWFLVPLGVPALQGWAHAMGIGILVTYLTVRLEAATNSKSWLDRVKVWVGWYPFIWCYGWAIHQLMT